MTTYTILINSYLAKDAVKSTSGLADVELLPLGVVSLDGHNQVEFRKSKHTTLISGKN